MTETKIVKKTYEELEFTDDFLFCKILQSNPELCRELLELILGKKIQLITYPEKQKTIEITADGKGIRLDIYVEDEKKNVYDVEMQTTNKKNLPKRVRYYQGMIDLNLIERGSNYKELQSSYVIFICTFDYFQRGLHKYTFSHSCEELPKLYLEDEAKAIFLCAGATEKDVSQDMIDFLDYVESREVKSNFTKELDRAVIDAKKYEKWRQEFMTLLMRDQENQEIGRELGEKIGKEIGEKIGKEIGQREKLKELIKKKIAKGNTPSEIAEILEEDIKTIEELLVEINQES